MATFFGGPAAGGAAGLVTSFIGPKPRAIAPRPVAQFESPFQFPGVIPRRQQLIAPSGQELLTGAAASRAIIKQILIQIALKLGRRIAIKGALAVLKRLGVAAGQEALGISGQQAAQLILARPKRRARGITAANLRTTRRTLRKVAALAGDLNEFTTRTRSLRAPKRR